MELKNDKWIIEADEELIQDYEQNAESVITSDHLIMAVKALGHSDEEARSMIGNSVAFLIHEYIRFNLFRALRSGLSDELSNLLKDSTADIGFVDKCQVFLFYVGENSPLSDRLKNQLRISLSEHYPDDLQYTEFTLFAPEGKKLSLRNYDLNSGRIIENIFEHYEKWFIERKEELNPQFEIIKNEINEYLKMKYFIEPQKDGFINWLIREKIGSLNFDFTLSFDNGILINGSKSKVNFWFDNKSETNFLDVEKSMQEYCAEKRQKLDFNDLSLRPETAQKSLYTLSSILPPVSQELTPDEIRKAVREILAPLSGWNPQKQKIMSDDDYQRLIDYTDHLVLTDTLIPGIQVIQQTGISAEHIRYTFYRLHERLFTTKRRRPKFYDFLRSVFRQLSTHEIQTINKKFKTHPASYFIDFDISQ